MPDLTQKQNGANYMKFQQNTMYWVQCGKGELYIHRAEVIIVSLGLPAMDDEEFFGENLVNNIAQFLNVDVTKDDVVNYLGAINTPWQIEASIKSGSDDQASLTGETVATFVHGIAEFSDLGVDRPGDYVIEFKVIHPAEATNYTLETNLIHNHTWAVTASISDPDVYDGTLTGVTSSTIDPATGKAHFLDLRLSRNGICPVKFTVTSTPAEYVLEKVLEIAVLTSAQRNLPREKSSELQIKFPIPFDVNTAPLYAIKVRNFLSDWFGIVVTSHSYMEGSLVVTVVVQGTTDGVDSAIDDMCGFISNGTTFTFGGSAVAPSPYLTVDGRQYYGVSCGPVDKDDGLHPGIIAAIVIACVVLILLLVVVLLWKLKVYPRTKTYDTNNSKYLGGRSDTIEDILFREDTFVSLKSRGSANTPLPPVTTSAPIRLWSPRGDIPTLQRTPEPGKPRPVTPVDPETQSNERLSFSGPKPIQPPLGENGRPPWRN
nr:hypothetical protein BaRGS_015796 [Batillaria attramentaria]